VAPSFPRKRGKEVWESRRGLIRGRDQPQSEEKVALVGFPFCPSVSAEAHLFGIVGAEFVAEELTVWSTPRLQLSVHDRQTFSAKRAARC